MLGDLEQRDRPNLFQTTGNAFVNATQTHAIDRLACGTRYLAMRERERRSRFRAVLTYQGGGERLVDRVEQLRLVADTGGECHVHLEAIAQDG